MLTRRGFGALALGAAAATAARPGLAHEHEGTGAVRMDNGSYTQPWFLESFLEFRDDLAEAHGEGKRFAIIWEQEGCPYCRETHLVNFSNPSIRKFVKANFTIVQLDMFGSREVTDFDGARMEERQLARKARVNFTPTISFFPEKPEQVDGKIMRDAEIMRMPGYFKPFHFMTMFEYVHARAYENQEFQRFLHDKASKLRAEGKEVKVW